MTVLVTGAAGFVGAAAARLLTRRGHHVTSCVRANPGPGELALDLLDATGVTHTLAGRRLDAVVHAAAVMPRRAGQSAESGDANVAMTHNLLAALSPHPPRYLLVVSSIDVYEPSTAPATESTPAKPVSAYAKSKLQTEQCCAAWCGKTETPLGIIRLTQVFGPGDRTHKFIPTVVQKVRTDEPVQVFGDGEDRRDYLYIEDGAAILADMTERCYQGLINGVTGRSVSLNEVLAALEAVAGRPVRVERQPRAKERIDRSFDATLLFQSLGVRQFTPLQEALGLTLAAP